VRVGGAACCWVLVPSSLEVGIILVRDPVQVWAITATSQPPFPLTWHSLTVLARPFEAVASACVACLVDVRAVLAALAYVVLSQAFATLTKGRANSLPGGGGVLRTLQGLGGGA